MSKYLVFGHKNPDTDAIGAALAFAYYLEKMGYDAEAVALGQANEETQFALKHFNLEAPRVIEKASHETDRVALVDHCERTQSVDDIDEVQVDFVVDHHRISNFETANPLFYRAEPIGCTSSVLYKMFKEQDIDIPQSIAGMMLSAIISDTLLFKSPTSTKQDREIAQELAALANVDLQTYGLELLKAGADLSDRSDLEIVDGDAKTFDMNGHKVRIGQVNTIGFDELLSRKDGLVEAMESKLSTNDYDLFLLVMTDILDNDSLGLVVGSQPTVVERAFGSALEDGMIHLPGVVSRKKQVVPPLTEAYNA